MSRRLFGEVRTWTLHSQPPRQNWSAVKETQRRIAVGKGGRLGVILMIFYSAIGMYLSKLKLMYRVTIRSVAGGRLLHRATNAKELGDRCYLTVGLW